MTKPVMDAPLMSNRQVVCVHAGQCGVQTASALWDTINQEYNLDLNGNPKITVQDSEEQHRSEGFEMDPHSFYQEDSNGCFQPR